MKVLYFFLNCAIIVTICLSDCLSACWLSFLIRNSPFNCSSRPYLFSSCTLFVPANICLDFGALQCSHFLIIPLFSFSLILRCAAFSSSFKVYCLSFLSGHDFSMASHIGYRFCLSTIWINSFRST